MIQFDRSRDDLGQERLEDDVIFPVHQNDLNFLELSFGEKFAQVNRHVDPAKSAAENEDMLFRVIHKKLR